MEIHLQIIGILLILLALIHIIFPKYFKWSEELKSLSLINKQMMTVHTFYIAFTVFLIGLLCITSASELINTDLGNKITFGLFVFWASRLIFQFFVYSTKLWKGKLFETLAHIFFAILWLYLSIIFYTVTFS